MNLNKIAIITCIILAILFISIYSVSAQFFYNTPISTYPWYFGTTSTNNYAGFPFVFDYITKAHPFYGNTFLGGIYPALGDTGFFSSVRSIPGVPNIFDLLKYYNYLTYAYQFYQIARTTPMFYMNDIVADYIGSSLYSYISQNNFTPQEAIINFIQQNLL